MDNLIAFLEELIKRFKEDKTAQDKFMFKQLSDDDKDLLGPLLIKITSSKFDFKYALNWGSDSDEEEKEDGIPQNRGSETYAEVAEQIGQNLKKQFNSLKQMI